MGTPIPLEFIDHFAALSAARDVAMDFRNPEARERALEFLRTCLKPMADELARPLNCQRIGSTASDRVLYLGMIGRNSICIRRNSQWCLLDTDDVVNDVSSEEVVAFIENKSYQMMGFYGHPTETENVLRKIPGIHDIVNHAAFIFSVGSWFENIDRTLQEREKRLQTLREHWSLGKLTVQGFDPCRYMGEEVSLSMFSVFRRTDHGESCASGSYFVKQIVDDKVATENARGGTYRVFDSSLRLATSGLGGLLKTLLDDMKEVGSHGQLGRDPLSEAEIAALESFFASIGT